MRDLRFGTIYMFMGLRQVEFGKQNKKKVYISFSINNGIFVFSHILCGQLFPAERTWIIIYIYIYMMKNMNMNMRINNNYVSSKSFPRQSVISKYNIDVFFFPPSCHGFVRINFVSSPPQNDEYWNNILTIAIPLFDFAQYYIHDLLF